MKSRVGLLAISERSSYVVRAWELSPTWCHAGKIVYFTFPPKVFLTRSFACKLALEQHDERNVGQAKVWFICLLFWLHEFSYARRGGRTGLSDILPCACNGLLPVSLLW